MKKTIKILPYILSMALIAGFALADVKSTKDAKMNNAKVNIMQRPKAWDDIILQSLQGYIHKSMTCIHSAKRLA